MAIDVVHKLLGKEPDQLSPAEKRVVKRARERRVMVTDSGEDFLSGATTGERLADAIARIGGSWAFILSFLAFLLLWGVLNTLILSADPFDPYPFIFLNLMLSMLAAIQAPIIMMSQNRQTERDRFMAAKDYEINLRAEIEVLALHEKIDHQVLMELQEARKEIAALSESIRLLAQAGGQR